MAAALSRGAGPPRLRCSRPAASPPCSPLSLLLAEPAAAPFIRAPLLSSPSPSFPALTPPPFVSVSLCVCCLPSISVPLSASVPGPRLSVPCPHLSQALRWPPLWGLHPSVPPPPRTSGCAGRPSWCFSLGSAVQLLPGKGQLAGRGRREVPSRGVPGALAGPSRLGEDRGVRLWSGPSVHTLRREAGAQGGQQPGRVAGSSLQKPLALLFPLPELET